MYTSSCRSKKVGVVIIKDVGHAWVRLSGWLGLVVVMSKITRLGLVYFFVRAQ